MSGYQVELTFNETLLLSDALSMFSSGPNQGSLAFPELLLKIGGALLDGGPDRPPVTVTFSREELWMIREIAKSPITVGPEKVGLNLLRKVYPGLLRLSAEECVHAAVTQVGETTGGEPTDQGQSKQRLQLWKGRIKSEGGQDA